MIDHPENDKLLRLARQAADILATFARKTWGEAWQVQAQAYFPGDGDEAGLLLERAFLPWAFYRWRPKLSVAESETLVRGDVTSLFLQQEGNNIEEALARFLKAARNAPFRFLVSGGEESGFPVFLDSLSLRNLKMTWAPMWDPVPAQAVVFGQVVDMDGAAIFTHEPVLTGLHEAPPEQLLPFFRQWAMAVKAFDEEQEEAAIIAETVLFRLAAAHVVEQPPASGGNAAVSASGEGTRVFTLSLDWTDGKAEPNMEGLSHHASWVRITRDENVLNIQAPGFLPLFATFRHMLHTLQETPNLRTLTVHKAPAKP